MLYDVFISHASEDKNDFVRTLAEALQAENVEVWYDEFSMVVGDSLRQSIDKGLAQSRFGIVVLSPNLLQQGLDLMGTQRIGCSPEQRGEPRHPADLAQRQQR